MWYTKQDFADGGPLLYFPVLPAEFYLSVPGVERADMRNFDAAISEKIFK